ncbi:MAG: RNA polymerase subunit sigma [Thiotrichaceae bacterium]|nr:MAG: RNA polymerase subunit sigma [Thiotrichaceae bacterium]
MGTNKKNCEFSLELTQLIPRLTRYALLLTHNKSDSEDLVQATLLRALNKQKQWHTGTNLDRWVFTIQSSIWKNELRSRYYRQSTDSKPIDSFEDSSSISDPQRTFLLQQVLKEVMNLSEKQRIPILLVYVEGFSYQEAADILDIPIGTVMSRLVRARLRLADKFNMPASQSNDTLSTQNTEL